MMDTPLVLGKHTLAVQSPIVLAANLAYAPDMDLDALQNAGVQAITLPLYTSKDRFEGMEKTQYAFLAHEPPSEKAVEKIATGAALRGMSVVLAPFPSCVNIARSMRADAIFLEPQSRTLDTVRNLKSYAGALLVHDAMLTQIELSKFKEEFGRDIVVVHGHAAANPDARELDLGTMSNIQIYFKHHIGFRDPTSRIFTSVIAAHMGAEYIERYVGNETSGCTLSLQDLALLAKCITFVHTDNYNSVHELVGDFKSKLDLNFEAEYSNVGLKVYMTAMLGKGLKATQKSEAALRPLLVSTVSSV